MSRLRRLLGPLVAIWLLCQAGGTVSGWIATADDCGCPHDAGGMCPMHSPGAKRGKTCSLRAVDSAAAMSIASLFGPVAPTPAQTAFTGVSITAAAVVLDSTAVGLRPVPPDPPPPRA